MAVVLSKGIEYLEPLKIWSLLIGGLVGIVLPLLAKWFPKYDKWIPSAAGLGLAWTFHWYYSLLFFLGAVIGYGFEKKRARAVAGVYLPRGLGHCRRRLADGRDPHLCRERAGDGQIDNPSTLRRLTCRTMAEPGRGGVSF